MKKNTFLLLLAAWLCQINGLQAQTIDRRYPSTDGAVNATLVSGDTAYIGGSFTSVFRPANNTARFAPGSTVPDATFSQLGTGCTVNASESDGSGGMYLAGYFDSYNGVTLPQPTAVIHILQSGSLDPSFGTVSDYNTYSINALKKKGSRLYIGGGFTTTQISGRNYLAALNAATGALLPWLPDAIDNPVIRIDATDSLVFINGSFANVDNQYSYGFAAINAVTGKYVSHFPLTNSSYYTYTHPIVDGNKLYFSGNFSSIGSNTQGLAGFDSGTAALDQYYANIQGSVNVMLADGAGGYYIGGNFSKIGNQNRSSLAHVLANGTVDPVFNPTVNGTVRCMALTADSIYFGGDFTLVSTKTRNNGAVVSRNNGAVGVWHPNLNSSMYAIAIYGTTVYMGGAFTKIGAATRNYVGATNFTNNIITTWVPNANGAVNQLLINDNGTSVFLGGDFSNIKSIARNGLAKLNTATASLSAWDPNLNGGVNAMVLRGSVLYIGGNFTSVNADLRQYLAAIDTASNSPTPFVADANDLVQSLQIINGKLYVGGYFSSIQNVAKSNLARIDMATGLVDSWFQNKTFNGAISSILNDNGKILAGGDFTKMNVVSRNQIAQVDLSQPDYPITSWSPNINSFTNYGAYYNTAPFYHYGNELFFGGDIYYTDNNGKAGSGIISLNEITGNLARSFDQYPNSYVNSITLYDNKLMVGGNFSFIKASDGSAYDNGSANIGGYDLTTWQVQKLSYLPNSTVKNLFTDANGRLIVTGDFTSMNNYVRNYLAAINLKTAMVTDFNPSFSSQVTSLALKDTSLFVGGDFTQVNTNSTAVSRAYVGAISTKTGKVTAWVANANDGVYTLAIKDTNIYIGGRFTTIKGSARTYGAALTTTGTGTMKNWAPNTDNYIYSILPLGNNVYIGGYFSNVKGATRNNLALVNNTNAAVNAWNPNPDGGVNTLLLNDNKVYAGGSFYNIGSTPRNGFAAFDTSSRNLTNLYIDFNKVGTYTGYTADLTNLAAWGKNIYTNGYYLGSIGDSIRNRLAGFDTATQKALAFNPAGVDYYSYPPNNTFTTGNNKLFVGGSFSTMYGKENNQNLAIFNLKPLTQATNLTFSNLSATGVTATVTKGSGDNRIVVVRRGNNAPAAPTDDVAYSANAAFGSGDKIDNSSYVVYSGSASNVAVSALRPNTQYQFAVYEYNGSGSGNDYLLVPALSGSITTLCLPNSSYDTVTSCVSYTWNGQTYTSGGDYSKLLAAANMYGCDSTAYLNLTINTTVSSNATITACGSYDWNGQTYTTSGSYSKFFAGGSVHGCDSTANLDLTINKVAAITSVTALANPICTNATTTLTANGVEGFNAVINWFTGSGGTGSNLGNGSSLPNVAPGTYYARVTADCGSPVELAYTIYAFPGASTTTVSVCNSYTWNGVTYHKSGIKTFVTTGAGGCDSTATLNLTILSVANTFVKTDAGCYGGTNGSITITPTSGVSPYTYRLGTTGPISSATNTLSNLKAGSYRVYVQDATGCIGVAAPVVIAQMQQVTATVAADNISCNGSADGKLTISNPVGTAPFNYKIGTTGTYVSFTPPYVKTGLVAGTYRIYIQDANGCEGPANAVIITEPEKVTAQMSPTSASCYGIADGQITISNPTGGTGPYSYRIGTTGSYNSLAPPAVVSSLKAGNYKVFIQDATGCSAYRVVTVAQPAKVVVNYTTVPITCSSPAGSISLSLPNNASGTFKLNPGGVYTNQNTYAGLVSGNYYGYAKDVNGCAGRSVPIVLAPATGCNIARPITKAIEPENESFEVILSPNPSSNIFSIVTKSSSLKPVSIRVIDVNGRCVYEYKSLPGQALRFGNNLMNGIYLVEVKQGAETKIIKALKNK